MHLSANKNYEVMRTNNFEVVIADVGGDTLTLAVESFPLPTTGNDPLELRYQNALIKVAGSKTLDDFELVVKDFIVADTEKIINDWQKKVYNPETGEIGWAADYKKNGTVYEYSPDGSVNRKWKLEGIWPNSVNYGDMDYNNADKKIITATLSCDKAYRV